MHLFFFSFHWWVCFGVSAFVDVCDSSLHAQDARGSVTQKQTSFSCTVKKKRREKRPLCLACCTSPPFSGCAHGQIIKLSSPQGTSSNSFSVNFHPLPNSDEPVLPPSPQWRICPRSLCLPLISFFFFFWLLPLCRRHAAYANTRSFIRQTPPLNECSLKWGHTHTRLHRGRGTCTNYNRRICMPTLTRPQSNIKRWAAEVRRRRSTWFSGGVTVYQNVGR